MECIILFRTLCCILKTLLSFYKRITSVFQKFSVNLERNPELGFY